MSIKKTVKEKRAYGAVSVRIRSNPSISASSTSINDFFERKMVGDNPSWFHDEDPDIYYVGTDQEQMLVPGELLIFIYFEDFEKPSENV